MAGSPDGGELAINILASWMVISSSLIMLNKHLMVDDGFNFPLALTAAGQLASALLGLWTIKLGLAERANPPSFKCLLTQILPVAFFSAGTLYYGNVAYLHLAVAFIQIMKVATPLFTLCISAIFGLEQLTFMKGVSMILILLGSGVATFVESNSKGFSWYSFSTMLCSALLEAVKVVSIQKLMGQMQYGPVELMVYLGPATAILLGTASYALEGRGLLDYGFACVRQKPFMYLLAIIGGFGVNLTTAHAIKSTSGLSFKVWGCMKNTAVVMLGCFFGNHMNALQALGYAVSTAGFILYSWIRLPHATPSRVKTS